MKGERRRLGQVNKFSQQGTPQTFMVTDRGESNPNGSIFLSVGEAFTSRQVLQLPGTFAPDYHAITHYYGLALARQILQEFFERTWTEPTNKVALPRPVRKRVLPEIVPFEKERQAFLRMKDDLLRDEIYAGKFVAIYDENVVGVDSNIGRLVRRVYNRYGYVPIYMGRVQKKKRTVHLPSPER